jgi:uncharacterized protein YhbP (UPF0306 family)
MNDHYEMQFFYLFDERERDAALVTREASSDAQLIMRRRRLC